MALALKQSNFNMAQYQEWQQLPPLIATDADGIVDLAAAAGTSLQKWRVPLHFGTIEIGGIGCHAAAAGGAQTTTGTFGIEVGGSVVNDEDAARLVCTGPAASHAAGASAEKDMNTITTASGAIAEAPVYPTATSEQLIEAKVVTQGVGAGDQTIYQPYLLYRIKAPVA